jgi:hypothetical protein
MTRLWVRQVWQCNQRREDTRLMRQQVKPQQQQELERATASLKGRR